jgi:hypothetical protein
VLVQQGAVLSSTGFDATAPVGVSERVLFLFSDILLCAAPLKGDRFHFLWKVMLGTSTMTTRTLDGDASVLVEVNEARWQPTPPFAVPTLRSFTYSRAGDAAPLRKGRAAAPAKSIDWAALVGAQITEQRKVYRPPAGKRGAYIERNLLSAGEWVLLSAGSTTRALRDGEVLIDQGVPFAGLFVVLDGALEIEREVRRALAVARHVQRRHADWRVVVPLGRHDVPLCGARRRRRARAASRRRGAERRARGAERRRRALLYADLRAHWQSDDASGAARRDRQRRRRRAARAGARSAVRSAIDLGRNDSARVKSIAEQSTPARHGTRMWFSSSRSRARCGARRSRRPPSCICLTRFWRSHTKCLVSISEWWRHGRWCSTSSWRQRKSRCT